jgi:hypothetical protein
VPVQACGCGVDLLRSCYTTAARFFSEDPETQVMIRWFFCDEDAKALPYPTSFNSSNWDSVKGIDPDVGELRSVKKKWVDGSPPPWGPTPVTCHSMASHWPDPVFLQVINASPTELDPPFFVNGQVLPLFREPLGADVWDILAPFPSLVAGGSDVELQIGCNLPPFFLPGLSLVYSFAGQAFPLFFDTAPFQMAGNFSYGDAKTWLEGVPLPGTFYHDVLPDGSCTDCGPQVWQTRSRGLIDVVRFLSQENYFQPCEFRLTLVAPPPLFVFAEFPLWYFPIGAIPADVF